MKEILLATSNVGKIAELKAILSPVHCIPQASLGFKPVEETGFSFIENAILKARHASRFSKLPALADDSGLVVLALGGQPGIHSARFAGAHATDADNIKKLLEQLANTPENARNAYFYCALALVQHENDPTPLIATGKLLGEISLKPQGDKGFGYDPVFYLKDYACTLAMLESSLKNTISHRALALKQLQQQLKINMNHKDNT